MIVWIAFLILIAFLSNQLHHHYVYPPKHSPQSLIEFAHLHQDQIVFLSFLILDSLGLHFPNIALFVYLEFVIFISNFL